MKKNGVLYIVATPLGNLEDMTYRAVRILREARLIAAEDTRRTRKLLAHFGIKAETASYREQNHGRILPKLIKVLENGEDVALVTDAGTPALSDPGSLLVREAAQCGFKVVTIPGPSAVTAALAASGISAESFIFAGYIPAKSKARRDFIESFKNEERTLVFFETPHRLVDCLNDMADIFKERYAVMCREMTKINEEFRRGSISEIAASLQNDRESVRGEITLVVQGLPKSDRIYLSNEELKELVKNDNRPIKEIAAEFSDSTSMNRSEFYRFILKATGRGD